MTDKTAVMDIVSIPEAIEWQARHAEEAGAPGTARVIRALLALEDSNAATARRIFGWQGLTQDWGECVKLERENDSLEHALGLALWGAPHSLKKNPCGDATT